MAPQALGMEAGQKEELSQEWLDDMGKAERALCKPIHLPPKARFTAGPHYHVQFDGGSQDGHGTGGFVVLDHQKKELVHVGHYYGPGRTNNEAESFALRDAMLFLAKQKVSYPVRVFGDSQLIIRFATRIYKRP